MTATSKAVTKAVFPVAGMGTRFLPATKSIPKELLPVVDKPLIQYAVEEAVDAGVDTLIFVISDSKRSILDHFEYDEDLESKLEGGGKHELLHAVRRILPSEVKLFSVVQDQPLGLGHAVLCARDYIEDDEFFGVLLPDDMVRSPGNGALNQLIDIHKTTGSSVIGVEEIDPELTGSYGIAEVEEQSGGLLRMTSMVEKPPPAEAPSNLGVVGRYVLDGRLFDLLADIGAGAGGEIQLTDGIARLMETHPVFARPLSGVRYDCGSRFGMLIANIDYALEIPELRDEIFAHIVSKARSHD